MKPEIFIPASELWSFFERNRDRMGMEQVLVARNQGTDHEIYITADEYGFPILSVYRGDAFLVGEDLLSHIDAVDTLERLIDKYLVIVDGDDDEDEEPEEPEDPDDDEVRVDGLTRVQMEDELYEREDELQLALEDFLEVLEDRAVESDLTDEQRLDLLDDIVDLLGDKYGVFVYRPDILVVDDDEYLIRYPGNKDEEAQLLPRGWGK